MHVRLFFAALAAGLALATPVGAETTVIRLSEPVASTADYDDYGSALPAEPAAQPLASVLAANPASGSKVVVTARIAEVCQKKGCFLIAQDGAAVARVEFADYSFFVPTDSAARTVTIAATIETQELSAERAAHLDADAGKPGLNQPGKETLLIAHAVRIGKP